MGYLFFKICNPKFHLLRVCKGFQKFTKHVVLIAIFITPYKHPISVSY